jgi:Flp pilus assembly pilin Flp
VTVIERGAAVPPLVLERRLFMAQLLTAIGGLVRRDGGQDLIEYGVLVALIAIVAMVGVTTLGNTIYTIFWSSIGQAV